MPLIECPSCGKKVSDNASTCPGCGEALIAQRSFNTWAYLIFWCALWYLTYLLYSAVAEMIFGKGIIISDIMKWINVGIISIPPTVIVYKFRKAIPALFAICIIGGMLALAYGMLTH